MIAATRSAVLAVSAALTLAACTVTPPLDDGSFLLAPPRPATSADQVVLYDGRPARPYDAIALVHVCSVFLAASNSDLQAQAAAVGADAVIEHEYSNVDGQCTSGIAVRFRR
jgi:hypothetical protein